MYDSTFQQRSLAPVIETHEREQQRAIDTKRYERQRRIKRCIAGPILISSGTAVIALFFSLALTMDNWLPYKLVAAGTVGLVALVLLGAALFVTGIVTLLRLTSYFD